MSILDRINELDLSDEQIIEIIDNDFEKSYEPKTTFEDIMKKYYEEENK